jgi:hypothetical protein
MSCFKSSFDSPGPRLAPVMPDVRHACVATQEEGEEKGRLHGQVMPLGHARRQPVKLQHLRRAHRTVARSGAQGGRHRVRRTVWLFTNTVLHPSNSFFIRAAQA